MVMTMREACDAIDQQLQIDQQRLADAPPARSAPAGWRRPLTTRELEVVALLCEGRTRAEIGEQLGISELTVKTHLARIGDVVGTGDQAGIVGACMRAGVIT